MSSWKRLNEILCEEKKYQGASFVTYADLAKLMAGISKRPPDKRGGAEFGKYKFDPAIFDIGRSTSKGGQPHWYDDLSDAFIKATTDSAKTIQGVGAGGTMTKGNWGAKVGMSYAPKTPHHNDRLGSGLDRYDIIIVADIDFEINKKGLRVPVGTLRRIAWAPSMGNQPEREERLQGLLAGRAVELPRRPMADRPGITNQDHERQDQMAAKRQAADAAASDPRSIATPDDADNGDVKMGGGGSGAGQDFKDRLAKINKSFNAAPQRKDRPTDPEDALFWTPDKKKER